MKPLPKLLVIVGPTASGKTSLAISFAKKYNGEIISADSRQIYKGMDIGTAKASRAELTAVPHHLINIRNPDEEYSVAEFKRDANTAIDDIVARGKLPILTGGTGLYIRAVVDNLDIPEIAADPALRSEIEKEIETKGLVAVFERLVALDPEAAYIVDPKNPRRIVRALEVATLTGKPFTAQRKKQAPLYNVFIIGINPPAETLRERIDRRIDEMMRGGLVDEVKNLIKKYAGGGTSGDGKNLPTAFDAIGYREIIDYLNGKCTEAEAVAAMKLNTWHFAKRQLTWFKKDKTIRWIEDASSPMEFGFLNETLN